MRYIKTLEKAQEDQIHIVKDIRDQEQAKCQAVIKQQEALKAPLTLLNESEDKTLVCLGDKKHAA